MKKLKLYLGTSVISHLNAPEAPEKEADTRRLWEAIKFGKYDPVLSDLVFGEVDGCPEPKRSLLHAALEEIYAELVERNAESKRLSNLYIEFGGLPPKSRDDVAHIALATISGCDIVLSWNFRHIVNLWAMTAVEAVNIKEGYGAIRILSPTMMLEEGGQMVKAMFDADDIHEMRVQLAKKYRNMSPEEAERDFQIRIEDTRRAIEEIRRQRSKAAVGPSRPIDITTSVRGDARDRF